MQQFHDCTLQLTTILSTVVTVILTDTYHMRSIYPTIFQYNFLFQKKKKKKKNKILMIQ